MPVTARHPIRNIDHTYVNQALERYLVPGLAPAVSILFRNGGEIIEYTYVNQAMERCLVPRLAPAVSILFRSGGEIIKHTYVCVSQVLEKCFPIRLVW